MKEIILTQGKTALVDDEDFERVNMYKWCAHKKGRNIIHHYAVRNIVENGKHKTLGLHRFILNITDENIKVDHKNRNTLDNRKENLRPCNTSENNSNRICMPKSTSKYLGVYFHKGTGKYMARIKKDKSTIYLGVFKDEKDAAIAYNKAAIKYHNQFANLNKI